MQKPRQATRQLAAVTANQEERQTERATSPLAAGLMPETHLSVAAMKAIRRLAAATSGELNRNWRPDEQHRGAWPYSSATEVCHKK
jgi:hypothetical protein